MTVTNNVHVVYFFTHFHPIIKYLSEWNILVTLDFFLAKGGEEIVIRLLPHVALH